jgi:transposase
VLTLPRSVRIFIASAATDMRRSIDGLMAMVEHELADAHSGHLFVFRRGAATA